MRYPVTLLAVLTLTGLIVSSAPPAVSAADIVQPRTDQVYVHTPSQFVFPPTVAGFARVNVRQYDRVGNDISVGYNFASQGFVMTVYVYPMPQRPPNNTLDGHFGACKAEVCSQHEGTYLVSEDACQISCGGQSHDGKHATFLYTDDFAGQRQALGSQLFLFTHGRWFVMYRVSCPVVKQALSKPAIGEFMKKLSWP